MLKDPNILDFKLKDLYLIHIIQKEYYLNSFIFNEDSGDLYCIRKYPKNRFLYAMKLKIISGKKSGYYFIKHTNY